MMLHFVQMLKSGTARRSMIVNHDVAGSSPAGGAKLKRTPIGVRFVRYTTKCFYHFYAYFRLSIMWLIFCAKIFFLSSSEIFA